MVWYDECMKLNSANRNLCLPSLEYAQSGGRQELGLAQSDLFM